VRNTLRELGFADVKSDAGVFYHNKNGIIIYVIVYVDDALFIGKNLDHVIKKKIQFTKKWECCDLRECKEFL